MMLDIKNMRDADLRNTNLQGANLQGADLQGANLQGANLQGADLQCANLRDANLRDANLQGAILRNADLRNADLKDAILWNTNLHMANLKDTCLDPDNVPNSPEEMSLGIGYRTETAGHIDKYRVGRYYSADVFSTSDTECHPGLYLFPTLKELGRYYKRDKYIKVITRQQDCHKAGNKYRTRWFYVESLVS